MILCHVYYRENQARSLRTSSKVNKSVFYLLYIFLRVRLSFLLYIFRVNQFHRAVVIKSQRWVLRQSNPPSFTLHFTTHISDTQTHSSKTQTREYPFQYSQATRNTSVDLSWWKYTTKADLLLLFGNVIMGDTQMTVVILERWMQLMCVDDFERVEVWSRRVCGAGRSRYTPHRSICEAETCSRPLRETDRQIPMLGRTQIATRPPRCPNVRHEHAAAWLCGIAEIPIIP